MWREIVDLFLNIIAILFLFTLALILVVLTSIYELVSFIVSLPFQILAKLGHWNGKEPLFWRDRR
jgi:hypothetical protein